MNEKTRNILLDYTFRSEGHIIPSMVVLNPLTVESEHEQNYTILLR